MIDRHSVAFQRLSCSPTPFWEPQILHLSISDPHHQPFCMYWLFKPHSLPYSLDLRDMVAVYVVLMSSKDSICLIYRAVTYSTTWHDDWVSCGMPYDILHSAISHHTLTAIHWTLLCVPFSMLPETSLCFYKF
jgi:hypothetical protein